MKVRAALETRHAGPLVISETVRVVLVLAKLADRLVSRWRDLLKAFCDFKLFRVAEPDLRRPDGAIDMDPIVPCGALERLAGESRPMLRKLFASVLRAHAISQLFLHALLLALAIRLLLVRHSRRFDKIDQSLLSQAQAARVIR